MDDGKPEAEVVRLGVRFKSPPGVDDPILKVVSGYGEACNHRNRFINSGGLSAKMVPVSYQIREGETEVECGVCGVRLDPVWVLKVLAGRESEWERRRQAAAADEARLKDRKATKCQHCSKMTRISRR